MSKARKNAWIVAWVWFAVSYTFTLWFDLSMGVVSGTDDLGGKLTFWRSFDTQICFLSTWVSQLVLFWSILNLIALVAPKAPKWFSNKQNDDFIVALCFLMFAVYVSSIPAGAVEGFKTWHQILKSVIEHMINPVYLFIMYFALPKPRINTGHYATHEAWWVVGYVAVYIVYAVIRRVILKDTNWYGSEALPGTNGEKPKGYQYLFPYGVMDPFVKPAYLWIPALLGVVFAPYGLEILFNYLSNLSYQSMKRKHPKLYDAETKSLFETVGTRLNPRALN